MIYKMTKEDIIISYIKKLLDDMDNSSQKNDIEVLLKDYIKKIKRLNTIIKRSDRQQDELFHLNKELDKEINQIQTLNNQVNNLLNNVAQGFLSFDENMIIEKSFSKECLNIFKLDNIYGKNISDILFTNDSEKKDLFYEGIVNILSSDDDMIKEMFLSLLPNEHIVNSQDIKIEYKLLSNNKFMLVLTDMTTTKKLEKQIKEQNQIQKMIVLIASNKNDFIELKFDFENFIANPVEDLQLLLRELHTFKGVFAQKEMLRIVDAIHNLESQINISNNEKTSIVDILKLFKNSDLKNIFKEEVDTINSILGDEFLSSNLSLNVNCETLNSMELKLNNILKYVEIDHQTEFQHILCDLEKFKYETVHKMLYIYPSLVKQMSQKLGKEIYTLEIVGDKRLSVSDKFKPFMKSLVHLFNNCVDHGIEDIETRALNEKDEIGTIKCLFSSTSDSLELIISDDGAGIDIDKLSNSAIKNGIVSLNDLESMSEDEKLELVFADSLTTKNNISTVSGRGVGMSAVKSEVDKVNGNIKIINNIGSGVEFIFTLPLNI